MTGQGVPLESTLRATRAAGRKLLVPYVTGGIDGEWTTLVSVMADAGADAIEVGIPFSDPVMDGPTIQAASLAALEAGATPPAIFDAVRQLEVPVPLVAMTYYNLVLRGGHRRFARMLVDAGVAGALVPDLPLEEFADWERAALSDDIETVLLAAPITPDDRLAELCSRSRGFIYGVNLMGVTGERAALGEAAAVLAGRLKAVTDKPVVMGFGVSVPEQAVTVAEHADGVIVASAIMRRILEGAGPDEVHDFVGSLRHALDGM